MNASRIIPSCLRLFIFLTICYAVAALWIYDIPSPYLINIYALAYILLGTFTVAIICHPIRTVFFIFKSIPMLLSRPKLSSYNEINQILRVAELHRHYQIREAEHELRYIKNNFLRNGLQQVLDGSTYEEIKNMLHWHKEGVKNHQANYTQTLRSMVYFAPAIGILGTVGCSIYLLHDIDHATIASVSSTLSYSMISTLYGFALSAFVFKPLSLKHQKHLDTQLAHLTLLEQTIFMIKQRSHPMIIKDTIDAFSYQDFRATINAEVRPAIEATS